MESDHSSKPGFFARLGLAMRLLFNADLAAKALAPAPAAVAKPATLPPERQHASALQLLASLQREGRFIDFLQQDVASFSDEEVGAAARVVHGGCRKVLHQALALAPVLTDAEGASIAVPKGFDAQRIRLTGNVAGEAPFKGSLKHHGWMANEVRLPSVQDTLDPRILAPAEVEL